VSAAISWWRTDFGEPEIDRVAAAIRSECISQGRLTAEFEAALARQLDVPEVVATTSGSMALLMACMALGVGAGDEVIVPNRTWIATAHAPYLLGARVVLVDVVADAPLIDPAAVERAITPRTKAIIPVHLNGAAADLDALLAIGARHGIAIIEDAAQAFLCHDQRAPLGTRGAAGCFSLSVAKLISTGQGGFVATRDRALAERLRALRMHGLASIVDARWAAPGFNFRFTDLQAAVGLAQLTRLPERTRALQDLHERYRQALAGCRSLSLPAVRAGQLPLYVEALCTQRCALQAHLAAHDIEMRPYYPDLDRATYFAAAEECVNSRRFEAQGLFLPSGPARPPADIERTLHALLDFDALVGTGRDSRQ